MEFERMDFYGLGEVFPTHLSDQPAAIDVSQYERAMAFRVTGSETRAALVLLDASLDIEIGKELANVLASKLAGFLSLREGWDVMISPPILWSGEQLKKCPTSTQQMHFTLKLKSHAIAVPILLFEGAEVHV